MLYRCVRARTARSLVRACWMPTASEGPRSRVDVALQLRPDDASIRDDAFISWRPRRSRRTGWTRRVPGLRPREPRAPRTWRCGAFGVLADALVARAGLRGALATAYGASRAIAATVAHAAWLG